MMDNGPLVTRNEGDESNNSTQAAQNLHAMPSPFVCVWVKRNRKIVTKGLGIAWAVLKAWSR